MEPADYIGRSAQQVTEFIEQYIQPILDENREKTGKQAVLKV
jgi:adenylosuccinate lyase